MGLPVGVGFIGAPVNRGTRTVRVDRSSGSPVGNPYRMREGMDEDEEERNGVCDAFDVLLEETLRGGNPGRGEVVRIGEAAGVVLRASRWDARAARREVLRLREAARVRPLRLDCWCHPRRCHAQAVALAVDGGGTLTTSGLVDEWER